MEIRRYANVRDFLGRAESWLLRSEAEHNLLLGITRRLLRDERAFEEPIYLATVEAAGEVAGCAFRTPPFKLGLTRCPLSAIPRLVRDIASVYTELPAVGGPQDETTAFARLWTAQTGGRSEPGMRQGIYMLETVVPPSPRAPGSLRPARPDERALVHEWADAFVRDSGIIDIDPRRRADRLISDDALYVWDDVEPRAMAATVAETPNGVRIGYVYTPPAFRGRGYATAAVALLSQRHLEDGRRYCCLYTDLGNPASNAAYRRVGYRKVCEVVDIDFGDPGRRQRET